MLCKLKKIDTKNCCQFFSSLKLQFSTSPQPLTKPQLKTLIFSNYSNGRFSNLLRNVVASPSVLLSASQNLITSQNDASSTSLYQRVSTHFSLEQMGLDIYHNRFEISSHCVTFGGSESKGEVLILPNLKLKVFIEAIRLVLEIVYDDKFVTFSYGGRVDMGRHTAIRYLKNSVENLAWWFTVSFDRFVFEKRHVDDLCLVIQEKIRDLSFIEVIKKLFECGVLRIELGGLGLGRGFPQECGLCSILINVYFDSFDKEIQDMRVKMIRENPKVGVDEESRSREEGSFFSKPLRMYAVRYLDEILVITSGSKMFMLNLKSWVFRFLEEKLGLRVDKEKSAIHSAVSEKVYFVGMELQAVPPSVLHPPMSEKAIRARKKYLRQKQVRKIELRNARERNRKKLGLKIFSHVFKKLKQSNGFKFGFSIDKEVQEIFAIWGNEVVQDVLNSLEERWAWHRMLTAGDFLSLRHIRNQLPDELVDAYDEFQAQVGNYLSPVKARRALEEEERRIEQEEEQKYANRTIGDLTRLCMKVSAPMELIKLAVKMAGFTNNMGRPRPISLLTALEDADIIKWYAGVGRRWLDFFCCCHNFKMVKTVVSYHLRFSCILTLAEKHEATKLEAIRHFTKDLKVSNLDGTETHHFPTERQVKMMGDKNLSDPKPVDGVVTLALIRLASDEPSRTCVAHFCGRTDTVTYRLRLLHSVSSIKPEAEEKWVSGFGAIHECLDRICLPLCSDHSSKLYTGNITLQDIDCTLHADIR